MADKKAKKLTVEALKHGDAKRKNIDRGVLTGPVAKEDDSR